ncbi:hypothetical protein FQN55_008997 [Onygenales sp. PD_40]|nr:hypothetical protein FQN55_008997 [Onygenales sp. PD_40]KAK2782762.1 hypothetical protein FQN52_000585 [Onygenales sp. PD_12]KAK2784167.1 hypothetical protein FQN53_008776 [Emmonsiellopsis sp. PD_33]KAK2805727.1 hypothetical protein FQN51_009230 [Onygenales sp. PD_10]
MPPAVVYSDDESGGESIPFKDVDEKKDADNEESDESGDEEDIYVVEKIMGHEFTKSGVPMFQVKWKGYENPEDQTLEPEENLDGAKDALNEYFALIGGRPEKPSKKRKSLAESSTSTPDRSASKKSKKARGSTEGATPETGGKEAEWKPKGKNWDPYVKSVDTIMRDQPSGNLFVYLEWENGIKAKISIQQCYEKCPQKMLQFYENHLVFKDG